MEPHWTSYIGMITGPIGALTGIGGSIMAYVSYRTAKSVKTRDLRIDLHRARNNAERAHKRLIETFEDAQASRRALLPAMGMQNSGWMQKSERQYDADRSRIEELAAKIADPDINYDALTPKQIETELVVLHHVEGEFNQIIDTYNNEIVADDKERDHLKLSARSKLRA